MSISIIAFIPGFLTAFGINAIFLLCAMGPKWKMAFFLYLLILKDILSAVNTLHNLIGH